ncbi:hypothetical protein AMECASPLE_007881 [Ameca splendens]|uniref:Uncharacterized protein n=1 Tax=Ameca splendens TaxID=208324 RepID=A0ABV0YLY7_9TELE
MLHHIMTFCGQNGLFRVCMTEYCVTSIYFNTKALKGAHLPDFVFLSVCVCVGDSWEAATIITPSPLLSFHTHQDCFLCLLYLQRFWYFEEATDLIGLAGKQSRWLHESCNPDV